MTLQQLLSQIFARARFGARPGHERITRLLDILGNPQHGLRTVHVIGTNGKGSTAAFLGTILKSCGVRAGRFTSPHLVRFNERFVLDGEEICDSHLRDLAERVLTRAPAEATFFELATAMAFLWFAEQGVEVALMEAGMGGISDATTVAGGVMTLLTPISLDHSEYLGDSLPAIAREKAGAIRPGQLLVVSDQPPPVQAVIDEVCREQGVSLRRWDQDFSAEWRDGLLCYQGGAFSLRGVRPGIPGAYQRYNAATALAAAESLQALGFPLSRDGAMRGIQEARWPGRMELVPGPPDVYLDGAHNPAGARALVESLQMLHLPPCRLVLGCMADKDLAAICMPLAEVSRKVYAVAPRIERALSDSAVVACCRDHGIEAVACGSLEAGLDLARQEARDGEPIVVAGSLFLVGEARALLLKEPYQPVRG